MLHWLALARAELAGPPSRPGALLVDLGCGGGLLAPHAARLGYRHVGVDLNTSALGVAAGEGARVVRADVGAVPLARGCAEVVCAGEILEHVEDLEPVVAEACRLLEPGGRLVVDTIAATSLARLVAVDIGERVPGSAPPGIHDPELFVDRARLLAVAWEHGVALRMRGIRPSARDCVAWALGLRGEVRMVPTWTTAVLFQAWGTKETPPASAGTGQRWHRPASAPAGTGISKARPRGMDGPSTGDSRDGLTAQAALPASWVAPASPAVEGSGVSLEPAVLEPAVLEPASTATAEPTEMETLCGAGGA